MKKISVEINARIIRLWWERKISGKEIARTIHGEFGRYNFPKENERSAVIEGVK